MNTVAAKIEFDLFCDWFEEPPVYRVYIVQDQIKELFTERTYTWSGVDYVRELVPLNVAPGTYSVCLETIGKGTFKIRNPLGSENVNFSTSTTFEVRA